MEKESGGKRDRKVNLKRSEVGGRVKARACKYFVMDIIPFSSSLAKISF